MSKERPILFNGEMVRAILEGRKAQTRRTMKPQPIKNGAFWEWAGAGWSLDHGSVPVMPGHSMAVRCPFGQVGDRLWVRETWGDVNLQGAPGIAYRADDDIRDLMADPSFHDEHGAFNYDDKRVKSYPFAVWSEDLISGAEGCWRPSIHMPRWASRIMLEITCVRVERLQDISEGDATAEGCPIADKDGVLYGSEKTSFMALWDRINFKNGNGWGANPWVWVIGFKRVGQEGSGNE